MKFVKYISMVLLICGISLTLLYIPYRKGYKTYYSFEQTRLKEIIEGTTYYDALFIGSSRTYYHVNPKIIDSTLHLKSFNAGIDGGNIVEFNMILKSYLAHHPPPKYVIVDLSMSSLAIKEISVFNPNIYFPFLNNDVVYNCLKPYKRVGLLKFLPFLQLTESDDNIRQGVLAGLIGKRKPLPPTYKGYLESGTDTICLPYKMTYLTVYWPVEKEAVALLEETIGICKKNDIKLILSYSPVYQLKDEKMNPELFATITRICNKAHIPFLNYRHLSLNNNHLLFRDEHHLNKYGADIFSNILANDIKSLEGNDRGFDNNNLHQATLKD